MKETMTETMAGKIQVRLIRKEEQNTSLWAGGTTTQLAIWPLDSDYKRRDFDWRLSSARVELEESLFTSLPGYHRILMILEGAVRLIHEAGGERREVKLNAFHQAAFDGAWKTTSYGQCVDFNLMTSARCAGQVEALRSEEDRMFFDLFASTSVPEEAMVTEAFYCLRPGVLTRLEKTDEPFETKLNQGDFVMFSAMKLQGPLRVSFENLEKNLIWGVRAKITT
jgi:environmental stress-induced protein Ves